VCIVLAIWASDSCGGGFSSGGPSIGGPSYGGGK
jgi:hypothetical protein